jgi:restriction modification system DNA specificity domain protein
MPSASSAPTLPFLERLLDGEKVEWKTLGEVCLVQRGASPRPIANYLTNSPNGVPWIKIGDTKIGSKYIESTQERITIEGAQRSRQLTAGDFILSNSMSYGRPYILKIDGAIHDGWASLSEISSSVLSDYLFYFLSSSKVQMYWEGKINSGSVSNLNADIIKALPIPIPPLRVQSRIVEILDKFTQLEAELEAELEARNKQYDFYRNRLLDFALRDDLKGQVEWKTLGEVCVHLRTGLNPRRNFKLNTEDASNYYVTVRELGGTELLYSEKTDLINDEALQLINNRSKLKVNDILFSGTGTIGKTAFISKEPTNWNIKEGVYALTLDTHYVLPMFVLRYLQTQSTIDWIDRMAAGGIVRSITMKNLEQLPIPLPPLSEQRRIVDILDRFDTLTNSISEGLPREIALRRKQYEYYRDALLNFPQPTPTA